MKCCSEMGKYNQNEKIQPHVMLKDKKYITEIRKSVEL